MSKLTDKQQRFVDEYLIDLNATQAAIRAGYSERTADVQGPQLLRKTWVAEAITAAKAKRSERLEMDQDEVLKRWITIATADPNDLVQYRRYNCRYCWGTDHGYQWSAGEYERAQTDWRARGSKEQDAPQLRGGLGYRATREPNPKCPECGGEGNGRIHVADTRKLSPAARMLYAGVKSGKDGLEVRMHDQSKALENVARHIGMLKQQHEVTGKSGGPVQVQAKSEAADLLRNLTNEQLAQLESIAAAVAAAGPRSDQGGARSA